MCATNAAKPRGHIFTKDRKVLLFYLREAKPSNLTQTKTYRPNNVYAVAPKGALGNPYSLHSEATKPMQPRPQRSEEAQADAA